MSVCLCSQSRYGAGALSSSATDALWAHTVDSYSYVPSLKQFATKDTLSKEQVCVPVCVCLWLRMCVSACAFMCVRAPSHVCGCVCLRALCCACVCVESLVVGEGGFPGVSVLCVCANP